MQKYSSSKFYSPVGIKEVTVMAKSPTMDEYVEFVYIDNIPAFADIKTSIKVLKKGVLRTKIRESPTIFSRKK